ncbi:MAG: inositol oxygenase [Bryobacteraceae bacterium]|nr:inositol oxygenase [Bryobacteraceae bacterium]MDW8378537.1 inositol oxygenase family protein [Bryobacterales bacterium]
MSETPYSVVEQWEAHLRERYRPNRQRSEFRNYEQTTPGVRELYRQNHMRQTRDFVLAKKAEYTRLNKAKMSVWEAMAALDTLVDDSDPDTDLSQTEHNFQTAEAARRDGRPRWFILAGLLHDLGKVLCLFGEPQWAVVGDTFPVGCAWSEKIVFHEFFAENPDRNVPQYQTKLGVYSEGCGLDRVDLSWGHDEYLYHVLKPYLPEEALAIIRYHSFYPCHREGEYTYLMNDRDRELFYWVREFNQYDLYSKSDDRPDLTSLRPFYEDLVKEYLPAKLDW